MTSNLSIRAQNLILVFYGLCIVALDQLTKFWAGTLKEPAHYFLVIFEKYYNPGISFGQFSDGSPFIRVVFLSVFFGVILLLSSIFIFYFLNRSKLFGLRLALITFIAGVTGNGLDRILRSKVVDFIILKPIDSVVFNVADIFLFFGIIPTIFLFFKLGDVIWFDKDQRKFQIINADFQLRFSKKLVMLTFFSNFLMAIFSYTVINTIIKNASYKSQVNNYLILGFLSLVVLFTVISFLFGLVISHRHVGPFVAFRRFLSNYAEGDANARLKLRELDEHKELEEISTIIVDKFKPKK